jgi:uncharacterized protein (DUF736 family)
MAYELKDGQGSLFKNERKTNDRQPNYTGSAKWKGETIRISLWKKQSSNGNTYLSLALEEPRAKQEPTPEPQESFANDVEDSFGDSIPF